MVTAKVLAKVAILAFFYFYKVQLLSNQKSVLKNKTHFGCFFFLYNALFCFHVSVQCVQIAKGITIVGKDTLVKHEFSKITQCNYT